LLPEALLLFIAFEVAVGVAFLALFVPIALAWQGALAGGRWLTGLGERASIADELGCLGAFRAADAIFPSRLANEELGDAQEQITLARERGCSRMWLYAKVVSTLFWLTMNTTAMLYRRFWGE